MAVWLCCLKALPRSEARGEDQVSPRLWWVDERLAALNDRVASAADAWLADPHDVGVHGRLVRAVRERHAYLHPTLDQEVYDPGTALQPTPLPPERSAAEAPPPTQEQPDEVLDHLADRGPVQTLGEALAGKDPREVLDRLRRSDDSGS